LIALLGGIVRSANQKVHSKAPSGMKSTEQSSTIDIEHRPCVAMGPENAALLERIDAFSLDLPEAELSFSERLARDNGWSHSYARKVIVEYKRFAFLAVAAGHPVTPSEDVDQAWHLHLCYTESYWTHFCREVLGRQLHQRADQGGSSGTCEA
jgi:hypothetical protein